MLPTPTQIPSDALPEKFARFSRAAGAALTVLGTFVLVGWALDIGVLKSVLPGWVTMKANTALGFLLAGVALRHASEEKSSAGAWRLAYACSAAVALIGALVCLEHLFGWNPGIDQMLFKEAPSAVGTSSPGRMAPSTAFCFLLSGAALLLRNIAIAAGTARLLALLTGMLGWLALTGYAYGVTALYGLASFTQMAFHTATAFLLLAAGILAARPEGGLPAVLASDGPGGTMARRMLPVAFLVPMGLGYLRLWGERANLYAAPGGTAFLVIAVTLIFVACIAVSADVLNASDALRLRSQEERDRQARTLEAILASLGEGVVVADKAGKFTVWNPAAEKIIGLGPKDVPPCEWTKEYGVFLPDQKTPYPSADLPLARAIRGESVDDDEQFLRRPDAPEGRFLSVTGRPLYGETGALQGGVVAIRDISLRKRTQKELEAFSYSVSNDLRAPLRHVDGFIELLQKKLGPDADAQALRYMGVISDAAKRMGALIDDLLAFSRMGRAEMREAHVALGPLLEEVRRELAADAPRVEWKIAELPEVRGDAAMLRLVLSNLLGNAVKFTRTRESPVVEVGAREGKPGFALLFVRDNGVGFDARYADKLFSVFQRLHRQEEFEGTGIGLANVRRIVLRHGGEAWAESAEGRGATFYVSLPKPNDGES